MGKIEDKIKQDLMSEIFNDIFKVYEFIDTRFKLEEKQKDEMISKINGLNNDLTNMLKDAKLS
jgi:ubiquinone/menaquinone biosynthesis C-methylase UbiE